VEKLELPLPPRAQRSAQLIPAPPHRVCVDLRSWLQVAPSSAITFLAYEMCFSALTKFAEEREAAARDLSLVEKEEPADSATD